jgi:hypothetical protein
MTPSRHGDHRTLPGDDCPVIFSASENGTDGLANGVSDGITQIAHTARHLVARIVDR